MSQAALSFPFVRTHASVTLSLIGTVVAALRSAATQLGGFYAGPLELPRNFDNSYPADLYLTINTAANSLINGQVVRFVLDWTRITAAAAIVNVNFTFNWTVPNGWLTTQPQRVLLDNGSGHTFNAHAFTQLDLLGIRIARDGPNAADTYAQATDLALTLDLRYTSLCRANCCL
jgi:hypothetical protein